MAKSPANRVNDQISFYLEEIEWWEGIRNQTPDSVRLNVHAATMIAKAQSAILILTDYKDTLAKFENYS